MEPIDDSLIRPVRYFKKLPSLKKIPVTALPPIQEKRLRVLKRLAKLGTASLEEKAELFELLTANGYYAELQWRQACHDYTHTLNRRFGKSRINDQGKVGLPLGENLPNA